VGKSVDVIGSEIGDLLGQRGDVRRLGIIVPSDNLDKVGVTSNSLIPASHVEVLRALGLSLRPEPVLGVLRQMAVEPWSYSGHVLLALGVSGTDGGDVTRVGALGSPGVP